MSEYMNHTDYIISETEDYEKLVPPKRYLRTSSSAGR